MTALFLFFCGLLTPFTLGQYLSFYSQVTTFAGSGSTNYVDGTGTQASFYEPFGVSVDSYSGNIFVGDTNHHYLRKLTPGGVVTTMGGSGVGAWVDGTGTQASFWYPYGTASDASGNVYVADNTNHRIRKVTPGAVVTTFAGSGIGTWDDGTGSAASFYYPKGLCVDSSGIVYVADETNHRIRKITPGGIVTTLAGNGKLAFADGTGTSASFWYPRDVAISSSSGNLYVGDFNNCRIRMVTPLGKATTLAGTTCSSSQSSDGTGTNAKFNYPYGVCVDATGNIYVGERSGNKIRLVTPSGVVSTLAGSGTFSFADGVGTWASFSYPSAVSVDSSGNLFVADTKSERIRRVTNVTCPEGYLCYLSTTSGVLTQSVCTAGTYCPAGSTAERNCSAGSYSSAGASACISCPAGSCNPSTSSTSASTCISCSTGTWSSSGASSCTSCPAGTYNPSTGSTFASACISCPAGYFCVAGSSSPTACGIGTYCPAGSATTTLCPSDSPGLLNSASSLAVCYFGGVSSSKRTLNTCNSDALRLGCSNCTSAGDCQVYSPGEPCSSDMDCASNLCLSGCCCSSSAVRTPGCTACKCLANSTTTSSTAGSCLSTNATVTIPLQCNSSSLTLNTNTVLTRVISFPSSSNVTDATPLVFLPSTSPLNQQGVDIILATLSACRAYASLPSPFQCTYSPFFTLSAGTYYFLGKASEMGMTATPSCGS